MFGISFSELLVIFGVGLLVLGPEKLPEVARTIGKLMGDLRRSSDALRREFYNSVYTPAEEIKRQITLEARNLNPVKEISEMQQELKHDLQLNPDCPDTLRAKELEKRKAAYPHKDEGGEEDPS